MFSNDIPSIVMAGDILREFPHADAPTVNDGAVVKKIAAWVASVSGADRDVAVERLAKKISQIGCHNGNPLAEVYFRFRRFLFVSARRFAWADDKPSRLPCDTWFGQFDAFQYDEAIDDVVFECLAEGFGLDSEVRCQLHAKWTWAGIIVYMWERATRSLVRCGEHGAYDEERLAEELRASVSKIVGPKAVEVDEPIGPLAPKRELSTWWCVKCVEYNAPLPGLVWQPYKWLWGRPGSGKPQCGYYTVQLGRHGQLSAATFAKTIITTWNKYAWTDAVMRGFEHERKAEKTSGDKSPPNLGS